MTTFTAHSTGRALVPDAPVKLPRGSKYRVTVEPLDADDGKGFPLLDLAVELSRKMKGNYPPDLAKNHDHYLYGRPKRR
jgi:hypothetical protein